MSTVAILGAGPLGSAVAHRLCQRGRVRRIILVDERVDSAAGKALDLQQSGPVEHFDTALVAERDVLAATGASVVVVADEIAGGEWEGDRGLAHVGRLVRAGSRAPIVFAGPLQTRLMERCYTELKIPTRRLIGTAPSSMTAAAQALTGLELNMSGVELVLVGRPPKLVAAWSAASVAGSLLSERINGHRLLALSASVARLWPPGPIAIAAATAPVVEALIDGSRRMHDALTVLEGELGVRGTAVMLPLQIGIGGIVRHVLPSLSPQERTELATSIGT
ncbi:MAG: hypothetical protein ABI051_05435 [Vicinamibacterales bacterium]